VLGLRRRLPRLAGLAALVLTCALPATASAAPGTIKAVDDIDLGSLFTDASQSDLRDNSVTVNPGEKVTFRYDAGGTNAHNVAFNEVGPQPTNCVQLTGLAIFAAPPIAGPGLPPEWTGECVFPTPGTYGFYCTVHPFMVGTVVVADAANQPPTVTATRTPAGDVPRGTPVAFTAVGSDPDGDTLTYTWDFGDGLTGEGATPSHSYDLAGSYDAKVTVADGKGGTASFTVPVTVTQPNRDPVVTAASTPAEGNVNTDFAFSATASDADGDTLTYAWDFGDGATATSANPTHKYATSGAYNAKVTVSDGKGGSATATALATVYPTSCTPGVYRDNFDGNELGAGWSVVRRDAGLIVSDGTVKIPSQAGDLYQTANNAKNLVLRTAPSGAFTIVAKINHKGLVQYQQGGIIVYGDDDNYVKLDRTATNTAANANTEFFEFVQEVAGTPRNQNSDHGPVLAADYPNDFYLRMVWDGTNLVGSQSTDLTNWTTVGRSSTAMPANAKIGIFALSNAAETVVTPVFDWFEVSGANVPAIPGCVNAPNENPVITSATRTPSGDVDTNTDVSFAASATDADGDSLTYAWDFGDSSTSTQQNPTKRYTAPGTYDVKLTVSDGKGGTATQTLNVVVAQGNRAPTVTAGRTPAGNVAPGTEIAFTATGADADGDALTYAWDFGDSTTSTQQNPAHTYADAGIYTAKVTVSDGKGGTGSAQVTVNVSGPNQDPTVTASRTPTGNTRVGVPVAFSATGTDADGDALTYAWDFGDSTTSTQQNPTHAFASAATYTVRVTVSDGKGGTGSATLSVVVQANRNPTISTATATPSDGIAPLAVQFNATATDPDGHAVTYAWDLDGDGTFETSGATASYTYTTGGGYSPVLRVTDGFGGQATRTLTVNAFAQTLDPNARYHVLVFSKTAAFRHSAIPNALAAIRKLGQENNFTVDATEDASLFTDAFLSRYDLVVFNSTTGDVLNDDQQAAFERFIQAGNGYAGIHSATDTEYGWPWYGRLTGAYFRNHPNGTPTATVVVEDATKVSTSHLPARWTRVDEWYNFQGITNPVVNGGGTDVSPRTQTPIHVLLTVDESTYAEADGSDGVDDDHPIAWCKRYDGGRMFYTALGHTEASYTDANFLKHLLGGMDTAAGQVIDADCGVDKVENPSVQVDGTVSADVPLLLALDVGGPASFGAIAPGVAADYSASVPATVTSTAGDALLSVSDPDSVNPGKLINGTYVLEQALQARATNAANPDTAFAPVPGAASPLTLLTWPGAVSASQVTIGFKQSVGAGESLRAGNYGKTLTFTLSTTTP